MAASGDQQEMTDEEERELRALVAKDLESPGAESNASGYTVASDRELLKNGQREKDVYVDEQLDLEDDHDCQIWHYKFPFLRPCLNVKVFVLCMCLLLVVGTAVSTGYLNSVITTIEKRFEIGSSISGIIAASYEMGSLISVIFVSYLGSNRHIPKWIGIGVIVMGIGSLLFALPHIIAPKYTIQSGMSVNSSDENICRGQSPKDMEDIRCIDEHSGNWGYVVLLIAAQILIGTGGTPILTLGITYVDNHVAKEKSPAYLAFIHASGALGPVLGYALGALLLQFYVDSFSHAVTIGPGHPQWIGAWWGGFIICGLLLFILALPFLGFPRVLVQEKRRLLEKKTKQQLLDKQEDVPADKHYGKNIKEIPRSILKLLKNPVYALLLPAISCEIAIVSGFVVFLPKYIETQFGTSTSMANLFTGGIGIPGAVIGILMGGYLLKRFQLKPKGALQFVLGLNVLAICGLGIFFFLGCDNQRIAGATLPYFNSSGHKIFEANLTSQCNQNCDCSPNQLEPICGVNDITYFSPCHAGCTIVSDLTQPGQSRFLNYSGCSCIGAQASIGHQEVVIKPLATSGPCKSQCARLLPFLILLVVMTFCVAGTQMPLLMVTLRSVGKEEKAFALGLQYVVMRLFAYVPAPIYFGNVIDSACLLWSRRCESHGSCLVYDIVNFRYRYVGVAAGLKLISMFFFVMVWLIIRRKTLPDDRDQASQEQTVDAPPTNIYSSLASLDRLSYSPTLQRRPSTLRLHRPPLEGTDVEGAVTTSTQESATSQSML